MQVNNFSPQPQYNHHNNGKPGILANPPMMRKGRGKGKGKGYGKGKGKGMSNVMIWVVGNTSP